MDMVEISPTLDINDVTTWLGIKTLYEQLKVLLDKGVLK
jgi:arginase family enzyme